VRRALEHVVHARASVAVCVLFAARCALAPMVVCVPCAGHVAPLAASNGVPEGRVRVGRVFLLHRAKPRWNCLFGQTKEGPLVRPFLFIRNSDEREAEIAFASRSSVEGSRKKPGFLRLV